MPPDQETPERPQAPERPEQAPETPEKGGFEVPRSPEEGAEAKRESEPKEPSAPQPQVSSDEGQSPARSPKKDPTTRKVESILEEDLAETYAKLPPDTKKKFRAKGEEVTAEISGMVRNLKVKARKVLSLIRDWLEIIPGINRFFLEQEAKIKTDKVMRLAEEEKTEREGGL